MRDRVNMFVKLMPRKAAMFMPLLLAAFAIVFAVSSCKKDKDPVSPAKKSLKIALDNLYKDNYVEFDKMVDYGGTTDSLLHKRLYDMIVFNASLQKKRYGEVTKIQIKEGNLVNDSVAQVFYDLTFSKGEKETGTYKMVKINDTWKIKARN